VLPSTGIGEDAFSFDAHECGLGTWSHRRCRLPPKFRGQGQSVTAGQPALMPRVLKTLRQRLHSWIALSHLLLVFNNPFARLAGFSGRERTPLPRYEQSEDLQRPIHPGHVTDERAAFKVEEVTEAELRMVSPGAGIDPDEIGRELGVGPQLLVPSKFVLDVRYHPCVIDRRQMPVARMCGDAVGKVLQFLGHDVLLDETASGSCRDRLLAEHPSPEAKVTSRSTIRPSVSFRLGGSKTISSRRTTSILPSTVATEQKQTPVPVTRSRLAESSTGTTAGTRSNCGCNDSVVSPR
jgi:hypothetical protein